MIVFRANGIWQLYFIFRGLDTFDEGTGNKRREEREKQGGRKREGRRKTSIILEKVRIRWPAGKEINSS